MKHNLNACWVINVPHNKYGYSFAVCADEDACESDIINMCLQNDMFEEKIDAEYAEIEKMDEFDYDYWENLITDLSLKKQNMKTNTDLIRLTKKSLNEYSNLENEYFNKFKNFIIDILTNNGYTKDNPLIFYKGCPNCISENFDEGFTDAHIDKIWVEDDTIKVETSSDCYPDIVVEEELHLVYQIKYCDILEEIIRYIE